MTNGAMAFFEARLAEVAREVESALAALLRRAVLTGKRARLARKAARRDAPRGARRRESGCGLFLSSRRRGSSDARDKGPLIAGCALEFLHGYSLVHDDLPAMDDDDLRRGRPTVHKAFDEATAILAGDALLTLAFEVMASPRSIADAASRVELIAASGARRGCCRHGGRADARSLGGGPRRARRASRRRKGDPPPAGDEDRRPHRLRGRGRRHSGRRLGAASAKACANMAERSARPSRSATISWMSRRRRRCSGRRPARTPPRGRRRSSRRSASNGAKRERDALANRARRGLVGFRCSAPISCAPRRASRSSGAREADRRRHVAETQRAARGASRAIGASRARDERLDRGRRRVPGRMDRRARADRRRARDRHRHPCRASRPFSIAPTLPRSSPSTCRSGFRRGSAKSGRGPETPGPRPSRRAAILGVRHSVARRGRGAQTTHRLAPSRPRPPSRLAGCPNRPSCCFAGCGKSTFAVAHGGARNRPSLAAARLRSSSGARLLAAQRRAGIASSEEDQGTAQSRRLAGTKRHLARGRSADARAHRPPASRSRGGRSPRRARAVVHRAAHSRGKGQALPRSARSRRLRPSDRHLGVTLEKGRIMRRD